MADSSTITFFLVLVVGFVVAKWAVTSNDSINIRTSSSNGRSAVRRRPVTQSMIEVVQSVGPTLSIEQIRYDLERTGNVELTVERYLSEGTLPFPPNYVPPSTTSSSHNGPGPSGNLMEKFGISENDALEPESDKPSEKMGWKESKQEREAQLRKMKQDMILRARNKMLKKETESST